MVENTIHATQAIVSLDVPIPEIIWGWMITLNMWAKSIGTGVVLVGAYLLYRYKQDEIKNLKWQMPVISFIALNVFLLFTLLDLHQPLRMINIFIHPHFTSAITVGAWMATVFTGIMTVLAAVSLFEQYPFLIGTNKLVKMARDNGHLYEKLLPVAIFLAIPVTLYTAIIMAEAVARGLWETPAELVQMMLAALMAGSATLLIFSEDWSNDVRKKLSNILVVVIATGFTLYMGEYFFSFKSSEAEATLALIQFGGSYSFEFWFAMAIGYIAPIFILISGNKENNFTLIRTAAFMALIGLYFAKDVWLKIPQMIPLS